MGTKELDEILKLEFDQLSATEKEEFKELFTSEEEFLHLKSVFNEVEKLRVDVIKPKNETKAKLDDLFREVHQKDRRIWYNSMMLTLYPQDKTFYKRPLVQIAAILTLVVLAFPLVNRLNDANPTVEIAQQELLEEKKIEMKESEDELYKTETELEESTTRENRQEISALSGEMAFAEDVQRTQSNVVSEESISLDAIMAPVSSVSVHPDGIYDESAHKVDYSIELKDQAQVLDLLTATF